MTPDQLQALISEMEKRVKKFKLAAWFLGRYWKGKKAEAQFVVKKLKAIQEGE